MLVASKKRTISKAEMQTILQVAASLTLREAMSLLYSLKPTYLATAVWTDDRRKTTLGQLGETKWPRNLHEVCSKLGPIWYRAGPPGWKPGHNWVKSMADQFVADRLLCAVGEFGPLVVARHIETLLRSGAP